MNVKNTEILVNVQDVSCVMQGRKILQEIHLKIAKAEIVTIIGPNGAGKTTLMRIILGLLTPTTGTVIRKPRLKIGYMPQQLHLESLMPLTVKRFLQLVPKFNPILFHSIIDLLSLEALQGTPIQKVSGGELQRILLARALLTEPELLVLDEPAQGVDILGQDELYRLLQTIRQNTGCAILMISHDLHIVMKETDSVICLNKHICCAGTPEAVQANEQFLKLFGMPTHEGIAIYTHNHNHKHAMDGEICK